MDKSMDPEQPGPSSMLIPKQQQEPFEMAMPQSELDKSMDPEQPGSSSMLIPKQQQEPFETAMPQSELIELYTAVERMEQAGTSCDIEDDEDGWPKCDNITVLLALNEAYSELISQMIVKVEKSLETNKMKQKEIQMKQRSQRENELVCKKKVPVLQYLPPYFKDDANMCPPLSDEARRKICNTSFDPLMKEEKKWTSQELRLLKEAVRASMIQNRCQPVIDRRDLLKEKMKTGGIATTDTEIELWKEEVQMLDRKIAYLKSLPDSEILIGDYSDIDWAKISNVDFNGGRTASTIRLKWINEQSPKWNKQPWTAEELKSLKDMRENKFVSWSVVADRLNTNRTSWQCFEKYQKEFFNGSRDWTEEEDEKLLALTNMLQVNGKIQWEKVSYYMPGRNRQQIKIRYTRTLDESIKHGKWTDQEDLLLMSAVGRYGAKDWSVVARAVPGRTEQQCRDRWQFVLDKKNGPVSDWNLEEDEKLLCALQLYGKGEWTKVAHLLPGRNAAQVKSRYWTLVSSKIKMFTSQQLSLYKDSPHFTDHQTRIATAIKNAKRDRTFRLFNDLTCGDDETGVKLCQWASSFPDHPNKARYNARKRLKNDERERGEMIMQAIEARHRGGDPPTAENVLERIQLTEDDVVQSMRVKSSGRRKNSIDAKCFPDSDHTHRRLKVRKNEYMKRAGDEEYATEFTSNVPEEDRVVSISNALCESVRRLDQYQWRIEFSREQNIDRSYELATEFAYKIIKERSVEQGSKLLSEGRPLPSDFTLPPSFSCIGAYRNAQLLRLPLSRLSMTYFNRASISISDPTYPQFNGFDRSDRLNIQLAPEIANSSEFLQMKAFLRCLLLEPTRLQLSIETEKREAKRKQNALDVLDRRREEEEIGKNAFDLNPVNGADTVSKKMTIPFDADDAKRIEEAEEMSREAEYFQTSVLDARYQPVATYTNNGVASEEVLQKTHKRASDNNRSKSALSVEAREAKKRIERRKRRQVEEREFSGSSDDAGSSDSDADGNESDAEKDAEEEVEVIATTSTNMSPAPQFVDITKSGRGRQSAKADKSTVSVNEEEQTTAVKPRYGKARRARSAAAKLVAAFKVMEKTRRDADEERVEVDSPPPPQKKIGRPRKSIPNAVEKPVDVEVGSPPPPQKKLGRPRKSIPNAVENPVDVEVGSPPPSKKKLGRPRKSIPSAVENPVVVEAVIIPKAEVKVPVQRGRKRKASPKQKIVESDDCETEVYLPRVPVFKRKPPLEF